MANREKCGCIVLGIILGLVLGVGFGILIDMFIISKIGMFGFRVSLKIHYKYLDHHLTIMLKDMKKYNKGTHACIIIIQFSYIGVLSYVRI